MEKLTHKPIILLVKAPRNDVRDEIDIFMEDYLKYPFDYYNIGGRSSGLFTYHRLNKTKRDAVYKEFDEKHKWSYDYKTKPKRRKQFNTIFYKHFPNFKGTPPEWRNGETGVSYDDDIIELEKVIPLVLDWIQDPIEEAEKYFKKAKKHREDPVLHKLYRNYAYFFKYQELTRDTNVYNITDENYTMPINTKSWWAVIIDVHY